MSYQLIDKFSGASGTALNGHTPDVGGSAWNYGSSFIYPGSDLRLAGGGLVYNNSTDASVVLWPGTIASNTFEARWTLVRRSSIPNHTAGVSFWTPATVATNYRLRWVENSGGFEFLRNGTVVVPSQSAPLTIGVPYEVRVRCTDGASRVFAMDYSADGGQTWTALTGYTDSSPIAGTANVAIYYNTTNTATTGLLIGNLRVGPNPTVPGLTVSPTTITPNASSVLTLTGSGTAWQSGTPGVPTLTVSGGVGASLSAQVLSGVDAGTATLRAGSAGGTLTITDPSGGTATVAVTLPTVPTLGVTGPSGAFASGGTVALGNVIQNSFQTLTLTLTNSASVAAHLGAISFPSGLTATTNPSGTTIAAGGSTSLVATLATATLGAYSKTISIPSDDPATPYTVVIAATIVPYVSYRNTVLAETGLVSYYPFDERSGVSATDAKGSNTGTYSGGFTLGAASHAGLNTAVAFDGSSGRMTAACPFSSITNIALEAWFNTSDATKTEQAIVFNGTDSGVGYGLVLNGNLSTNGQLSILHQGIRWIAVGSPGDITTGTWHHVVLNILGSGTHEVWLDKNLIYSANPGAPGVATGSFVASGDRTGRSFNGSVDEVATYNAPLSASQIAAHYNAAVTPPPPTVPTLRVTGLSGAVATGGTVALGSIIQGGATTLTLTIANLASVAAHLGSITFPSGLTATSNPSSTTIAAGGSTSLVATLAATTLGAYSGTISIPSDDPATPYTVVIAGTVLPPPFVKATFDNAGGSNVDLASYTPGTGEVGGSWAPSPFPSSPYVNFYGSAVTVVAATGRVRQNTPANNSTNTTCVYTIAATPPTPDFTFEADFVCVSNATGAGLLFRFNPTTANGYGLVYNIYSGWNLCSFSAGNAANLTPTSGAVVAGTLAGGQTVHAKVTVTGPILTVALSGAQTGTWSCNDTTYSGAGNLGIYFQNPGSDTSGVQLDNLAATNLGTPIIHVTGPGSTAVASGGTYIVPAQIQNATTTLSFILSNTGTRTANLGAIAYTGCAATADPSHTALPVGGSATITVTLPTTALGAFAPTISIPSDSATSPFIINLPYTVVTCNPSAPAGPPTGYTFTGTATSGDTATSSAAFTVALTPAAPALTAPISITPSDGGAGGTFNPPTIILGTTPSTRTFTYTPPLVGSYTLSLSNNAGLANPAPLPYTSKVQLGSTPTSGISTTPDFGGFQLGNVGAWAELFRDITGDAVDPLSSYWLSPVSGGHLHFDGGNGSTNSPLTYGIPFSVVPGTQAKITVGFGFNQGAGYGASESDNVLGATTGSTSGQYPFPANAPIEGLVVTDRATDRGGDQHISVYDRDNQLLYETWSTTTPDNGTSYHASNGAIFDMARGTLRPADWTSGDAAGLPILPFLVRYDEAVLRGVIPHAIRVTFLNTGYSWVYPARHSAGGLTGGFPCGLRMRLTSTWYNANIANFTGAARVILEAMRKYGVVVADNGSNWYFQGAGDSRWDMANLATIGSVPGSAFEVVQVKPSFTLTGPSALQQGVSAMYTIALYPVGDTDNGTAYFHIADNHGWATDISFSGTSTTFSYTPTVSGTATLTAYDTNARRYPPSNVGQPVLTASVITGPATTYTLTGPLPNYGPRNTASSPLTAALPPSSTVSLTVTVTPSDNGGGGTFSPSSVSLTTAAPSSTFTYTPTTYGTKSITTTNNGGLTNPAAVSFYVGDPATSHAQGATLPAAKFPVSLPANATVSGPVTITPSSSGGGTFYPSTVVLTNATPSAMFTFSPASSASTTISFTNDGGLTSPAPTIYTPGSGAGSGRSRGGIITGGNL